MVSPNHGLMLWVRCTDHLLLHFYLNNLFMFNKSSIRNKLFMFDLKRDNFKRKVFQPPISQRFLVCPKICWDLQLKKSEVVCLFVWNLVFTPTFYDFKAEKYDKTINLKWAPPPKKTNFKHTSNGKFVASAGDEIFTCQRKNLRYTPMAPLLEAKLRQRFPSVASVGW